MKTAVKDKIKPKIYNTKPKIKQRMAFKNMVENGGNVSKAMIAANYSKATAKVPQKLTESKGFMQLCNEIGLTDDLLVNSLTEDIVKKPQHRHKELELGFKVKGLLRENVDITSGGEKINSQSYERARETIREYIRTGEGSNTSDMPEPTHPL